MSRERIKLTYPYSDAPGYDFSAWLPRRALDEATRNFGGGWTVVGSVLCGEPDAEWYEVTLERNAEEARK